MVDVVGFEPEFRGEPRPGEGTLDADFTAYYVVRLGANSNLDEIMARFAGLPEVASVSPVPIVPLCSVPDDSLWSDTYYYYQPSRLDLHAPEAWDLTVGDTSIVVAVLDTGVVPYHPDLGGTTLGGRGQMWANWAEASGVPGVDDDGNGYIDDVGGWDFVDLPGAYYVTPGEDWRDEDNDPNDFSGHGTEVAGVIGALSDNGTGITGTAWKVRMMPLRVGYQSATSGGVVDLSYAAQAIRYATRMGASIINMSFSSVETPELKDALDAAIKAGVVIVVAAGNNGTPNYIGQRDEVITVGATDRSDFVQPWSNHGDYVDLAAPGEEITTTAVARTGTDSLGLRQCGYVSGAYGTSFAAPMVSGAAALVQSYRLMKGKHPFTSNQMRLLLQESADDISAAQDPGSTGYGTGRLDILKALIASEEIPNRLEYEDGAAIATRSNPTNAPVALYWRVEPGESASPVIRIHDVSGRRVRSLLPQGKSPGITWWDGSDENGRPAPSGVYFAELTGYRRQLLTKFALLRR
jgi:subtilisin family serine protease